MDIKEFTQEIIARLAEENIETKSQVINRSTGENYNGLTKVSHAEVGISPVFNLDAALVTFGTDIDGAVAKAKEVFNMKPAGMNINPEDFKTFEKVKKFVVPRLVPNSEAFTDRLGVVLEKANDLKVIFSIKAFADGNGIGEAVVDNGLLELWGISVEELYDIAMANLPSEEPEVMEIGPMVILSNKHKTRGAVVCLDREFMNKYQAEHGEVYILPSSRHEVILVSKEDVDDVEALRMMVATINAESVDEKDRLTDNVYVFNGETLEVA